jgi:ParB family chromosome partitioning protein
MSATEKGRRLGRGLSALLGEPEAEHLDAAVDSPTPSGVSAGVQAIPIELIRPNPEQPRRTIGEDELSALAASIAEKGIVQPILVRPISGEKSSFEIVAGERRWRAAQRAQLHEIPALIRELNDLETLEIGIIENVQRTDLNPVEEAQAYKQLIDKFGHSQERIAQSVSKSRSHVANMVRLLALPGPVLDMLAEGQLTTGHARAIATAPDPEELASIVVSRDLSVRAAEALSRKALDRPTPSKRKTKDKNVEKDSDTIALEADITARLGLDVDIRHGSKGGEIRVHYQTLEQLDDVCRRLSATDLQT